MRIVILTDLEGVSGIVDWDKHERGTPLDAWQRKLMTGEVNAAISGAFDAGATSVKIFEGHDSIDIMQMDERATIVPGMYPAVIALAGVDESYDAMIQIGSHSMAGTPDGVLCHTGSRKVEFIELNGIRVGEIGLEAAQAGDFGIPPVMVSGDVAACREAQAAFGKIEIAPVKTGYDCHHADCLHPNVARELIREKVKCALKRLPDFKKFAIPGPVRLVQRLIEPYDSNFMDLIRNNPKIKAEIIDERTIAFMGRNTIDAYCYRLGRPDLVRS